MVLFLESRQQLYRLNTTAAMVWSYCEEGFTLREIALELAATFNASIEIVRRDLASLLTTWRQLGLLNRRPHRTMRLVPNDDVPLPVELCSSHSSLPKHWYEHRVRLTDLCFRVRFSELEQERLLYPLLTHLQAPPNQSYDVSLDVVKNEEWYVLVRDAVPVAKCRSLLELAPLVHAEVLDTVCAAGDWSLIVHAAAVSDGHRCIVFPGATGSGKSTLTAALIQSGLVYCTDETVLLESDTYHVRPVPICLGLKHGSWGVLTRSYPRLNDLPIHRRADGQAVRYLSPPLCTLPDSTEIGYPAACIVFPNHRADGVTTLISIPPAEALCRLTNAGYDVTGGLDASRVEELVQWVDQLNCYELRITGIEAAVSLIKDLL